MGRKPTGDLETYDLALRGWDALRQTTREANAESRRLFAKALELDPGYAKAHAGLGWAYLQSWQFLWSTDPDTLERGQELAQRAIALDDTLAAAHRLLAQVYLWKKEHEAAIAQAERDVALAPNDADGYETLAEVLVWAGRAEEGIGFIRHAMRLNPHYRSVYLWTLGHGYYLTGRTQDALDTFGKLIERNPNFVAAHAYRAVLFTELGREKEARAAWAEAGRLSPEASLSILRQRLPYRRPADLDRFLTAMNQTGIQ
jgi:adenylate cyclase